MSARLRIVLRITGRHGIETKQFRSTIDKIIEVSTSKHIKGNELVSFHLSFHNKSVSIFKFDVVFVLKHKFYCINEGRAKSVTLVYEPSTVLNQNAWNVFVLSLESNFSTIDTDVALPLFNPSN